MNRKPLPQVFTHEMLFGNNEEHDEFMRNRDECTPEETRKIRLKQMDEELDRIRALEGNPDYQCY